MSAPTESEREVAPKRGRIPADTLAHRLMLARAMAGHLSIREAADLCGYGRGAWTNWERGARPLDVLDVVRVVAERLDVDEEWLLFGGPLAGARTSRPRVRGITRPYLEKVRTGPIDNRPPTLGDMANTTGVRRPVRVRRPAAP